MVTRRPSGSASTARMVPVMVVACVGRPVSRGGARAVAIWPEAKPSAAAAIGASSRRSRGSAMAHSNAGTAITGPIQTAGSDRSA